jgi:hypothetical protein
MVLQCAGQIHLNLLPASRGSDNAITLRRSLIDKKKRAASSVEAGVSPAF